MDHVVRLRQLHLSRAKLKATSQTSALLAGFAMVALVELDLGGNGPNWQVVSLPVLVVFGICTTLLVGVHLLALMMSTCMLPYMDSVINTHNYDMVNESPHVRMKWYIELAWCFSTVFGLLLFLLEIAVVFWIKFAAIQATEVTYVTTSVLALILIVFLCFTVMFYRKLTIHKYELSKGRLDDLQKYYTSLERDPSKDDVHEVTTTFDDVLKIV